jgi:hypothetical protein
VKLAAVLLAVAVLGGRARADALPDLALDTTYLRATFDLKSFPPGACETQPADLCVGAPGARRLLRFGVLATNVGGDLVLGVPKTGDPMWVYSACHQHYHFESFALYELRRADGTGTPIFGQKRSFCVEDSIAAPGVTTERKYCCSTACGNVQGIQHGWGDLYPDTLPCQWIDITDLPAGGDFELCVTLNFLRLLPDADPSNDSACVPVHIDLPDPARRPRVRVRKPARHARVRAGATVRIVWQSHTPGGDVLFDEIWLSRDGGATYGTFVTDALTAKARHYRWIVPAGTATDAARVKVVVCARTPRGSRAASALQCGEAVSPAFRIVD